MQIESGHSVSGVVPTGDEECDPYEYYTPGQTKQQIALTHEDTPGPFHWNRLSILAA